MSFNNTSAKLADAVAIVPSDTAKFNIIPDAIYVGGGGDLTVVGSGPFGATATFKNIASGATLNFSVKAIKATGTTATGILALFSELASRPTASEIPDNSPTSILMSGVDQQTLLSPVDLQSIYGNN